jgi:outer membrane receptor protein involved in Fe transport
VFVSELRKHSAWLSVWLLAAYSAMAAAQLPARVVVVDLLRALSAAGFNVLYSSDLVPRALDAPDALPHGDPMSRAVAALAANGLILRRTAETTYVVTLGTATPQPSTAKAPAAAPRTALDEVSVFASRYAFTAGRAGEPVDFDDRQIEEMPGAKADSIRALHAAPGLASNLSARPYVRGAMLDDVLFEYDGIALAEPFHFRNFQSVMSIFNPFTVSRAEVYTGGFPVNYGTRSGGVIDLTPASIPSGSEYSIGASLLSYDLETVGRSDSHPLEWLFVARASSDDQVLQRLLSEPGEPAFYDMVGHLRWTVDSASAVALGWLLLEDRVAFNSNSQEGSATGRSHDAATWLRWDWVPADTLQGHSSLAIADTDRNNRGTVLWPGIATGRLVAERSFSTIAVRSDWAYAAGSALRWNFGGEFIHETAELEFHRREILANAVALAFGRPVDASITSDQSPHSSAFGLYSAVHRRWQAFEAEIGLRFDFQDYQGFGERSQLTPRINLRYDFTDRWRAYASWGQFTQAQRVDEYRAEANQVAPDPASRATHVIAGIAHESEGSTNWRLEAYRNHWSVIGPYYENSLGPLSLVPQLGPDRVLVAPADADAAGLELSAQRSFGPSLSAWGTYSLSHVTDDSNGREWLRTWDQPQSANLGVAWTGARISVSALLGWHSGWPKTPVAVVPAAGATPAYLLVGPRNSERWRDYFSGDLRLSTSVPLAFGELSFWLDGTNLTGRSNLCCVELYSMSSVGPGPAVDDQVWLPRVVNVGFTVKVRRP